jgi:hypothetical protein
MKISKERVNISSYNKSLSNWQDNFYDIYDITFSGKEEFDLIKAGLEKEILKQDKIVSVLLGQCIEEDTMNIDREIKYYESVTAFYRLNMIKQLFTKKPVKPVEFEISQREYDKEFAELQVLKTELTRLAQYSPERFNILRVAKDSPDNDLFYRLLTYAD